MNALCKLDFATLRPTSEFQVRPLVGLTPGQQRQAWGIATGKAVDPSARQVNLAVYLVRRQSMPEPKVTSEPQEFLSKEGRAFLDMLRA
jgi:hypothetical protein